MTYLLSEQKPERNQLFRIMKLQLKSSDIKAAREDEVKDLGEMAGVPNGGSIRGRIQPHPWTSYKLTRDTAFVQWQMSISSATRAIQL